MDNGVHWPGTREGALPDGTREGALPDGTREGRHYISLVVGLSWLLLFMVCHPAPPRGASAWHPRGAPLHLLIYTVRDVVAPHGRHLRAAVRDCV